MKPAYSKSTWNQYSNSHFWVLTSMQRKVYKKTAKLLYGNVADFGCGSARIIAYIQDNAKVNSYYGVDLAEDMIKWAVWLKTELKYKSATLKNGKIEHIKNKQFDSACSLNSFYAWSEPQKVLNNIYNLLKPSGLFILATPNDLFNPERLTHEVRKELLGSPHYTDFIKINASLAANKKAHFVSMDKLTRQIHKAGFKLVSCHQKYFLVVFIILCQNLKYDNLRRQTWKQNLI